MTPTAVRRIAGRVRSSVWPAFLGGGADYRTVEVTSGGRIAQPWHQHVDEQVVVVLRGEFLLEWPAGDGTGGLVLRPGSEHRIAAGMTHRLATHVGGVVEVYTARDTDGAIEDEWTDEWVDDGV